MDEEKTTMTAAAPETAVMDEMPLAEANGLSAAVADEAAGQNGTASGTPRARITLDVQLTPVVNYAQQQNGLPLVRRIAVSNAGEAPVENLELRVSSPSGFVQPASFFVIRRSML